MYFTPRRAAAPPTSLTMSATLNVPGAPYVCKAAPPAAPVPSPKSHAKVYGGAPPNTLAAKLTESATRGEAGQNTKSAAGTPTTVDVSEQELAKEDCAATCSGQTDYWTNPRPAPAEPF